MKKNAIFTKQHIINLSKSHIGIQSCEKNGMWKGDKAGYVAIHAWIKRHKGSTKVCEHCNKEKTIPRSIQWANIDHKYSRNLEDWISLCAKCHKKHDIENNLVKVIGKSNPFFGKKHSEETKEKNRLAHLGRTPWNKGIKINKLSTV